MILKASMEDRKTFGWTCYFKYDILNVILLPFIVINHIVERMN